MRGIMNEEARDVWKAWADGMAVQFRTDQGNWKVMDPPNVVQSKQPHVSPGRWRIKPIKPPPQVLRYRIWLMKSGRSVLPTIHHIPSENDDPTKFETYALVEALDSFIRWDGPERVTEVEVEE